MKAPPLCFSTCFGALLLLLLFCAASLADPAPGDCGQRAKKASIGGCQPLTGIGGIPPDCPGPCIGEPQSMPCWPGQQIAGGIGDFGFTCEGASESCCIYVTWPMEQCDCVCVSCWIDWTRDEPDYCATNCGFIGQLSIKVSGFCYQELGPGPGADSCGWTPA